MPGKSLNLRRIARRRAPPQLGQPTEGQIARIDELTAAGRANWIALLAYLAFVLVTTLGVEDADFFVESRQTELPIIGVSIPTFAFFVFAPVLGAALYGYLHLHVRKVAEALIAPPPGDPPLEERIKPWLLNDFILRHRYDGAIRLRPLDRLAAFTTLVLVWWSGPLVLTIMWVRTWPAHTLWLSLLGAACLVVALYAGALSWAKMRLSLSGRNPRRIRVTSSFVLLVTLPLGWLSAVNSKGLGEVLIPPVELRLDTAHYSFDFERIAPDWANELSYAVFIWYSDTQNFENSALMRYFASMAITVWNATTGLVRIDRPDLSAHVFTTLPIGRMNHALVRREFARSFCEWRGVAPTSCQTFVQSNPGNRAVFNAEWQTFRRLELALGDKPDFTTRDLRRANFLSSSALGVSFERANLSEAVISWARMEGADFLLADLRGAHLHSGDFRQANFDQTLGEEVYASFANFEGTSISGSWAEADLSSANFQGANLSFLDLSNADLVGAQLVDVDLSYSTLVGADLTGALLAGSHSKSVQLTDTNLDGVKLNHTALRHVDLRSARYLNTENLQNSFGDATALLPLSDRRRPSQWSRRDLPDQEFFARWRGWVEANAPSYWEDYAPEEWREVEPVPPPEGCTWQ